MNINLFNLTNLIYYFNIYDEIIFFRTNGISNGHSIGSSQGSLSGSGSSNGHAVQCTSNNNVGWKLSQMFTDLPDDAPINKMLPKELLLRVFSFLDVVSLCRSAQVV